MASIDIKRVREIAPITRVLDALGYPARYAGDGRYRSGCPIHQSSGIGSRILSVSGEVWYCHRCHAHGDVVDLVQRSRGLDWTAAAVLACAMAGVTVPYIARSAANRKKTGPEKRHGRGTGGDAPRPSSRAVIRPRYKRCK